MWKQRFGNSADRDEAQYRRGAALGLTFGELFLLLAFVLLLLLALLESERQKEQVETTPFDQVRQAAQATGTSPDDILELIQAAERGGPDGLSRAYIAAEIAGMDADKLADVLAAVNERPPEDFDMVRADLASGAEFRKRAPDIVPEDLNGLNPDTIKRAVSIAEQVPDDLEPEKLAIALEIAEDADEPTVTAIRRAIAQDAALGGDIAEAVGDALGPLIKQTGGSLNPSTGSVTLPESVLFQKNSAVLSEETQQFLTAFCGPWIKTVHSFGTRIAELRIEGHSSSEWADLPADDPRAYLGNLDLSQRRSATVLQFCLGQDVSVGVADWAKQRLVAVGLSSSRPVLGPDGSEDARRSRRVVFGFETDKVQVLDEIRKQIEADDARDQGPGPQPENEPEREAEPQAEDPGPPPIRERYDGPARVVEAGLLEVDGALLRLASIAAPDADAVCSGSDGQQRPCGRIAAFRLAQWVGDATVTCMPDNAQRDALGHPLVHCALHGQDVAGWLTSEGHAKSRDLPTNSDVTGRGPRMPPQ
ncbi:MAG: hypothetical protein ABJI96_16800 [Paracoccaceae bacterium]